MALTLEEKIELVCARYDPDDVVEALQMSTEELLRAFPQELEENWHKFEDILDDIEEVGGYNERAE